MIEILQILGNIESSFLISQHCDTNGSSFILASERTFPPLLLTWPHWVAADSPNALGDKELNEDHPLLCR